MRGRDQDDKVIRDYFFSEIDLSDFFKENSLIKEFAEWTVEILCGFFCLSVVMLQIIAVVIGWIAIVKYALNN